MKRRSSRTVSHRAAPNGLEPILKSKNEQSAAAGLYVVATPIGNARDVTLRGLDVLKACDLIAAEDTRVTAKLLAMYGISRPLTAYNDYNADKERPRLLARLREGARIALVSDAGTPLISDPGYKLVTEAIAEGLPLHTVPGASSVLAALTVAGLPTNRFFFAGFLPSKSSGRQRALERLKGFDSTLVLFEAPQRLAESLADMRDVLGMRDAAVARELTKFHEEVRRDDLVSLAAHYASAGAPKGEIVIVLGPPSETERDSAKVNSLLEKALRFMPLRSAVDLVGEALELPRSQVYDQALVIKSKNEGV